MKLNKKIQNILVFSLWSLAVIGLLVVLGFTSKALDHRSVSKVDIEIKNIDEHQFITNENVLALLHENNPELIGSNMENVDIARIERMYNTNPYIANAEVFKKINGELQIEITTKRPIARIINFNNESFYLDEDGYLMPWSSQYTADLPVFTGNIYESYDLCNSINYSKIDINDSVLIKNNLYGIYLFAKYLASNEFWNAQIVQVFIDKDVELIPRAGSHTIVLGDFRDIDSKMNNLFKFYQTGLSKVGWNIYEKINLKYKNQIICTKISANKELEN
ncbi:MAG: hypothetical protein IT238_02220 [Bacteroidia bacterium]|nr:hypothetical protein [Bacteroidia bacterium]MCZ2249382.1 hypothetical protein [Bacteroidia bacterium]